MYEIQSIEGKGLGCIAIKDIKRSSLILSEKHFALVLVIFNDFFFAFLSKKPSYPPDHSGASSF